MAKLLAISQPELTHETQIGGIPNLAVLPKFQRRGIGRQLIEKALAYLQAEGMLYAAHRNVGPESRRHSFLSRYGLYRNCKAGSLHPTAVKAKGVTNRMTLKNRAAF